MYNHAGITDSSISFGSVANGNYPFHIDDSRQCTELSFVFFVDGNGNQVVPSAGTVTFQVCVDGKNWKNADGGLFSAASGFLFPPFYNGRAVGARFVLSGIVGAVGFSASIRQHDGAPQPWQDMLTSDKRKFRRLRVDVAQTGFFEGREFRTFNRFNIAAGQTLYMRFSCPVDFILFEEDIVLNSGQLDHTAYRTVSNVAGSWTPRPTLGRNIMSSRPTPFYTPVGVLETGGTFTPGDEVGPPMIPKTSGSTAQQSTVPAGNSRERGLLAGTYYLKMTAIDGPAVGVYYLEWEERP